MSITRFVVIAAAIRVVEGPYLMGLKRYCHQIMPVMHCSSWSWLSQIMERYPLTGEPKRWRRRDLRRGEAWFMLPTDIDLPLLNECSECAYVSP